MLAGGVNTFSRRRTGSPIRAPPYLSEAVPGRCTSCHNSINNVQAELPGTRNPKRTSLAKFAPKEEEKEKENQNKTESWHAGRPIRVHPSSQKSAPDGGQVVETVSITLKLKFQGPEIQSELRLRHSLRKKKRMGRKTKTIFSQAGQFIDPDFA